MLISHTLEWERRGIRWSHYCVLFKARVGKVVTGVALSAILSPRGHLVLENKKAVVEIFRIKAQIGDKQNSWRVIHLVGHNLQWVHLLELSFFRYKK